MLPSTVSFHDAGIGRVLRQGRDLTLTLEGVETEVADAASAGANGYQIDGHWFATRDGALRFRNVRTVVINDAPCDDVVAPDDSGTILSIEHETDGRVRLATIWSRPGAGEEFQLWLIDCDDVEWTPSPPNVNG